MGLWWAEGNLAEKTELRHMECSVSQIVDDPLLSSPNLAKDSLTPNGKVSSNIITLEPYSEMQNEGKLEKEEKSENTNRTYQRQKWKPDPTLIHFDSLFGCSSWPRFLIFKTETDISAAKFENLLLSKYPTREMTFRPISRKEWLVEATTKAQSESYQSLNNMNGLKVSVERHDKLNSIEGSVILPHNNDCDGLPNEALLLNSLKIRYPNVENVQVYEIPNKRNPTRKLRIAKIKFEGQFLPPNIKIEGQRRELIPFIPKPLQCKNCSKYGHTQTRCRNSSICAFCSSEEHVTTWNCGPPKCCNCGQDHHARSKVCPFYIYNTELKLLVSRSGMSIQEAKQELKARGLIDPARNTMYSQAVKRISMTSTKTPKKSNMNINKKSCSEINNDITISNSYDVLIDNNEVVSIPEPKSTVRNRFEILRADTETDQITEDIKDMDIENNKGTKRLRENSSPPKMTGAPKSKTLKSITDLEKSLKQNESFLDYEDIRNITPSPVFPSTIKHNRPQLEIQREEKQNYGKLIQDEEAISPQEATHENRCGCHECFLNEFEKISPFNKTTILNMVRNFISLKTNTIVTELETHVSGCLCVEHLKYYRENKIKIIDKLLSNQKLENLNLPSENSENENAKKKINIVRNKSDDKK